jgi:hypothetical protein
MRKNGLSPAQLRGRGMSNGLPFESGNYGEDKLKVMHEVSATSATGTILDVSRLLT